MEENQKELNENKHYLTTLVLCFFLGILGAHRFYNKKMLTGILQLITLGGLGIWAIIDIILILTKKFKINNDKNLRMVSDLEESNKDWLTTFLLCWVLGIFGAHRFYTKKIGTGILQLLTAGGFGLWMLIDLVYIARHQFLDKDNKRVVKSKKSGTGILTICIIILLVTTTYNTFTSLKTIEFLEIGLEKFEEEHGFELKEILEIFGSAKTEAQIFMEYDASEEEIEYLYEQLNSIEGVSNIRFVSKEDAYNIMKEEFGENEKTMRGITSEAFSVSYTIEIDNKKEEKIIDKIENLSEVRKITSRGETIERLRSETLLIIAVVLLINYKITIAILIGLVITRTIISIICLNYIYKNKKQFVL